MKAVICDIKRFAVHDGSGIRTTVFFKGCPLKCVWCHNPESISFKPQLAYYENKCIGCGECVPLCPAEAHSFATKIHAFDPDRCISCGNCVQECLGSALTLYGKEMTLEELLPLLLEDRDFYESSGGGVTLSGGECLCQPEFCAQLLRELKSQGIHTAVDTCGFVSRSALEQVLPYTDVFLYDLKAFDEDVHIRCTGQSNARILENLAFLDRQGKEIQVRIPYVPNWNDHQMEKIAAFLKPLKNITAVEVLPYHNYAGSKYDALNLPNTLPAQLPTPEQIAQAEHYFSWIKGE